LGEQVVACHCADVGVHVERSGIDLHLAFALKSCSLFDRGALLSAKMCVDVAAVALRQGQGHDWTKCSKLQGETKRKIQEVVEQIVECWTLLLVLAMKLQLDLIQDYSIPPVTMRIQKQAAFDSDSWK